MLLEIDRSLLEDKVVDEDLYESGEPFPHLYGELPWDAVVAVHTLPCSADGTFELPSTVSV